VTNLDLARAIQNNLEVYMEGSYGMRGIRGLEWLFYGGSGLTKAMYRANPFQ